MLAFNLGVNDFAKRHDTTLYMGLNVSLAGVRGILAAFLGMGLYAGWESRHALGFTVPPFHGLGPHLFLLTTMLTLVGLLGFINLNRVMVRNDQLATAD